MPRCFSGCVSYRRDTIANAWTDVIDVYGPAAVAYSTEVGSLPQTEVALWTEWATDNGISPLDVDFFGKWLIWWRVNGTVEYGNLPTRIRDHVGISCIPCPYDLRSDDVRTRSWLELEDTDPLPTRVDHTYGGQGHYLKVAQRGNVWGFECTHPGCTILVSTGHPYFHA